MTKSASELAHLFRALKAPAAARALPALADRAREEAWSYERFAEALLGTEVSARDSHGGEGRIKAARFPARKTLEEFDFTFQRSVKKTVVEHLGQLDFLHARENVILLGPPDPWFTLPSWGRHWSNSPAVASETLILRPFRRPLVTWTACSSPRWTLCKTVWRATRAASRPASSGRYPSGTSATNRRRISSVSRIRQGACGVVCSPGSRPVSSQR